MTLIVYYNESVVGTLSSMFVALIEQKMALKVCDVMWCWAGVAF